MNARNYVELCKHVPLDVAGLPLNFVTWVTCGLCFWAQENIRSSENTWVSDYSEKSGWGGGLRPFDWKRPWIQ